MTRAVIATIHVAAKQLGLDADMRHDLQLRVTGKASLTDMTPSEQEAVLQEMRNQGFRPMLKAGHRKPAPRGDLRLAHALWGKLARAGTVDTAGAAGLNAFIRSRFGQAWGAEVLDVDRMQDAAQIATVVQALKAMCRRAGLPVDKPSDPPGGRR